MWTSSQNVVSNKSTSIFEIREDTRVEFERCSPENTVHVVIKVYGTCIISKKQYALVLALIKPPVQNISASRHRGSIKYQFWGTGQ